jgi:hypothetical protein
VPPGRRIVCLPVTDQDILQVLQIGLGRFCQATKLNLDALCIWSGSEVAVVHDNFGADQSIA